MRKARNYWQEMCAVLAILVGLVLTGVSWADEVKWPANVGPTNTLYQCNTQTGNCWGWSENCIPKGTPGIDSMYFSCGNTLWLSLEVVVVKQWGKCNDGVGLCTQWSQYWCLIYNVYKDSSCSINACYWYGWAGPLCDPEDPNGE